jgi:uncharacterized protein
MQRANTIIDLNCDAGPYAFREYPVTTVAEVTADLARFGITTAYLGSAAAITYVSPQPANERLAAEAQAAELHGIEVRLAAVLNPEYPGALRDLHDCAAMGFRALKLYPTYHTFDLLSYETVRLAETAAEWGWPVLLAVRAEDERHHHPLMKVPALAMDTAIAFARDVPQAVVVLCTGQAGEIVSFLQGVARDNVLAEVSFVKGPLNAMEDLVATVDSARLAFGTHLPFSYAQTALAKVREAAIADETKAAILSGNAARLIR